jgi:imidazole glycerol-phosphate synthase subunit HisF
MNRQRVIPVLLLKKSGLYKTNRFEKPVYIGDPINAVKIFNDKEVDELIILDIDATIEKREPNYDLIEEIVSEAFMPIGYGGGISDVKQVERIIRSGVEKIILNYNAYSDKNLITQISNRYGAQAIVASIDVKKSFLGGYKAYLLNAQKNTNMSPVAYAKELEQCGVGEIFLTMVDNESQMKGYDYDLITEVSKAVSIPVIANGGAGDLSHFKKALQAGASAVAAGSMFVYIGKLRGVLINYPTQEELKSALL